MLFLLLHNVFYNIGIYNSYYGFIGHVTHLYTWKEYFTYFLEIILLINTKEMLLVGHWFLHTMFFASFSAYNYLIGLVLEYCDTLYECWIHGVSCSCNDCGRERN